jgi:uncharacterized membrane protein YjgN (DUF898 family)
MSELAAPPQESPPEIPQAPPPLPGDPAAGPPPLAGPPPRRLLAVRFTGTGGEYFRIWAVNLLLTIVTLGIYSAWAKVRRTRWFWGNTQVDGASFQYHGSPGAILRGRIAVGVVFVAYSLAGRLSITAAIVAAVLLGLLAPWLFLKAMRFKLTNTTWRGLRFGFRSSVGEAYAALAPSVVLWVLFTAEASTLRPGAGQDGPPEMKALFALYALVFISLPFLHERFKRWQHGATTCGSLRFALQPSKGAFYGTYALTFLVGLLPFVALGVFAAVVFMTVLRPAPGTTPDLWTIMAVFYPATVLAYLLPYAFFSARIQRQVWSRTQGGPIRFDTRVTMGGLLKVWLKHGLLTLITAGLYWPYAAVAITRYRLECLTVQADAAPEAIAAGQGEVEPSAAGEGAVDFLGWDFGL